MMKSHRLSQIAGAVVVALGLSTSAMAADTTSAGLRGNVVSPAGELVSGAEITVFDTRTGSVKTLVSNETGSFNLRGLPVGGPYIVSVKSGAGDKVIEDVYLSLGDTLNLSLNLQQSFETIQVTGARMHQSAGEKGPSTNFGLADLEAAPAINRDIKDLVRIDPRIYINESRDDGIQCAGASSRFNSFTVDGIRTNDNFGLGSGGYPTIRIPFSYDSISQVNVELAPFDVQYGGFTACNINAVTKSGTNELEGGFFYDYTSDSLRGDSLEGEDIATGDFDEKRYGFNVGGALIKDTLFFFTSYEKLEGSDLFDRGTADSNAAVPVAGLSQAQYEEILDISRNVYGYEPGDLITSLPVEDEKIMAKLDWVINEQHRASIVYNYNDGNTIRESDGDSNEFEFSNHYYDQYAEFESYVASLNSDWTDNFSTEIRIGTADFEQSVTPLAGTDFGEVQIRTENNGSRATVYLGADDSRHANRLTYDTDTFKIAGTYLVGDHVITGGYEQERLDVFNLFVQHTEGEFRFDSIDDFRNGLAARVYYYNATGTNNPADAAAEFGYEIHTAYIQDEYFSYEHDLTVTFGLRYDWYTSDDFPEENPLIEELYGFSNRQNFDGEGLLQPRLGINWQPREDLEVRGGIGLYSGGNPNVWLGNNYQNNGVVQTQTQFRGVELFNTPHTGDGRPIWNVPQNQFDAVANGEGGAGGINILDPDFEIPSEWKYAIGATLYLPNDYVLMADYLYTDVKDAAIISDITRQDTGVDAPDGRPIYTSSNGRSQDFMLTNVKGDSGYRKSFSLALSKTHDWGLDWTLAYAYTATKEVSPMTSSVAFSNYLNNTSDPENPGLGTSNYEIPHRFTLKVNYTHEFFEGYETKFSVFASANEGRPYSYTFDGGFQFGDSVGFIDRHLLYIPDGANDPNVVFGDDFDQDAFFAYLDSEGLSKFGGRIMPRNSINSDWWTKFDIKISQELPGLMDGHKASAFIVVENFGNLLNDDWGVLYETSFPRAQEMVAASINDNGQYVYEEFIQPQGQTRVADASLWEVRVGVKYDF
ncbi:TonB-dependent receptor [Thalassotalea euphylliae]|uniref:TonB-dependent receptor n=1 Tax=Thalassotalea euphylliae TaxID=1655234 RepID=A0A3E0UNZ4_9GAMM|nr:TonB-dependent receptor [Thalassotalea euphylliae]REL37372.1 TonB-dependent receptor [Thalassotalea euphylliae]